jgi:hypothetical protein
MLSDLNSPESKGLIRACALLERMRTEVAGALSFDSDARVAWHSRNEVNLATLLLLAEQAQVGETAYEKIRSIVCLVHKPLTGHVELDGSDIERIGKLLIELENEGFPCWFI